jgi:ubiquinone/menaquinone biosynthesis C-methylase UbiE
MRESRFREHLLGQLGLQPGMRVLDLGCGTGTLTVMIRQRHPEVFTAGLDGDPEVLEIARRKAARAGVTISWQLAFATDLPFASGSLDRVVSSLMVHHLALPAKQRAFAEVHRVLRPGGAFHILDLGRPFNLYTRLAAIIIRHLEETADQLGGRLPRLLHESGFDEVRQDGRFSTVVGPLISLRAERGPDQVAGRPHPLT